MVLQGARQAPIHHPPRSMIYLHVSLLANDTFLLQPETAICAGGLPSNATPTSTSVTVQSFVCLALFSPSLFASASPAVVFLN